MYGSRRKKLEPMSLAVNARVMGGQIHARAWELLLAMLVMDAIFGISGVIAAPIYYAYLKSDLSAQNLLSANATSSRTVRSQ